MPIQGLKAVGFLIWLPVVIFLFLSGLLSLFAFSSGFLSLFAFLHGFLSLVGLLSGSLPLSAF